MPVPVKHSQATKDRLSRSVLTSLLTILRTLRRLRLQPRGKQGVLWAAAATAVCLLLRHVFNSANSKYITNPARVGRRVNKDKDKVDGIGKEFGDFDEFDVIIVGGGTSGCVLASRLSEDPSVRVLLLEAGGSGQSLPFSRIPAVYSLLFYSKHDYGLRTEPQSFARNKSIYWPRGKMLGGCSSVNAQMAQYGSPGDFDEWACLVDDDSWSWKEFSRYFNKFERYRPDSDFPVVDEKAKGSDGPVQVGYFNHISEASKQFIKACMNVGISYSPDFNTSAGTRGVNRVMTYVSSKAQRVSSETAYLTKDCLARPNLKVVINAQVTRVLSENVDGNGIKAVGVEFTNANTKKGPRYRVRSRKEVILSAGAVHSPQILMLSGIGPAHHLESHSIKVIRDIPAVGQHLTDHPVVDIYLRDKFRTSHKFLRPSNVGELVKLMGSVVSYLVWGTGALASNFGEAAAFCRSDDPVLFPPNEYPQIAQPEDSTSSPDGPDLEIFITPLAYKEHGQVLFSGHTRSMHVVLLRPLSSGSITLRSAKPWDKPIMDPRYLESPADIEKLARGISLILKIAQTEPLASLLDSTDKTPELDHELHLKSHEELLEIVKERVETLYHPVGTCRMGGKNGDGCVDSRLRVYGVEGLRVCDASIFPKIVSGHTAGAVFAVAEKLADIMNIELNATTVIPKV